MSELSLGWIIDLFIHIYIEREKRGDIYFEIIMYINNNNRMIFCSFISIIHMYIILYLLNKH